MLNPTRRENHGQKLYKESNFSNQHRVFINFEWKISTTTMTSFDLFASKPRTSRSPTQTLNNKDGSNSLKKTCLTFSSRGMEYHTWSSPKKNTKTATPTSTPSSSSRRRKISATPVTSTSANATQTSKRLSPLLLGPLTSRRMATISNKELETKTCFLCVNKWRRDNLSTTALHRRLVLHSWNAYGRPCTHPDPLQPLRSSPEVVQCAQILRSFATTTSQQKCWY